jgi:hypothetical protein
MEVDFILLIVFIEQFCFYDIGLSVFWDMLDQDLFLLLSILEYFFIEK